MTPIPSPTAAGFSPQILTDIFTRLPVSNLLTFALTCKHWRLCTQREEYYRFLVEKLQIERRPSEAAWQTFFKWKNSRNFIILLDTPRPKLCGFYILSSTEIYNYTRNALTPNRLLPEAVNKVNELVGTFLPDSRGRIYLINSNRAVDQSSITNKIEHNFHSRTWFATTDGIANAVDCAFGLHKDQRAFPKATTTEIHLISEFQFNDIAIRRQIQNSNLEGHPQILFRCHRIGNRGEKAVENIKRFQKKRSAKNRWHVSITFPGNKGAKRQKANQ